MSIRLILLATLSIGVASCNVETPKGSLPVEPGSSPTSLVSRGGVSLDSDGSSATLQSNGRPAPASPPVGPDPAVVSAFEVAAEALEGSETLQAAFIAIEPIEDMGSGIAGLLEAKVAGLKPHAQVAAWRVLHAMGKWTEAVEALCGIAASDADRDVRVAAAELVSLLGWERHGSLIEEALGKTFDPPVRIELAVALWNVARAQSAKLVLSELLKSDSANIRQQAALGLGRLSVPDLSNCRAIIEAIADEPTDRGRIAQQILRRDRLGRELEHAIERAVRGTAATEGVRIDTAILDRVRNMIRERYIYAEKVTARRLSMAAASGVLRHLDPYSMYLDAGQTRRAAEIRQFSVPTLGISLGERLLRATSTLYLPTIIAVTPGSPADRAGLLPGDQIVNIARRTTLERVLEWRGGRPTEYGETFEDFLDLTLGGITDALLPTEPVEDNGSGNSVALLIRRGEWYLNRWVPLQHELPLEIATGHEILPGGMGYLRLGEITPDSPAVFRTALAAFHTAEAKGILLDLRHSSGGSVEAAIRIAGGLLPEGTPIATVRGRNSQLVKEETFTAAAAIAERELPLVVLVNGGTADAAEVLAAALHENQRATLVGSTTYGRAIVQELMNLEAEVPSEAGAAGGEAADKQLTRERHSILLTVGHWYTPSSKRRISEGGLTPEVSAVPDTFEGWVYDQLDEMRGKGLIRRYVREMIGGHPELSMRLAANDGGKTDEYPDWSQFRELHPSNLTDDHVRHAVRQELRIELAAQGKLAAGADLQADREFVAGVRALARLAGIDLSAIKEFSTIATGASGRQG